MKIKVKNKRKFIRGILIMVFMIIGFSVLISKATYSYGEKQYKIIFVSEGDTLWSIADTESSLNPYYKNKDIRNIVNDIFKQNNLISSNLQINQELKIPLI